MDVKAKMAELGMSNVDMLLELRNRGIEVQPPFLSNALRQIDTTPKAQKILSECEEIIWEKEHELV